MFKSQVLKQVVRLLMNWLGDGRPLLKKKKNRKYGSAGAEALKAFCFVSVSVFLLKQNPVSVKLPFPY